MKKIPPLFIQIIQTFLFCITILILLSYEIPCLKVAAFVQSGLSNSDWPCKGYDARRSGQSPYAGTKSETVKWTFQTDGEVISSPAIGEDKTIYIGSMDKKLYAVNPDGTLKWEYNPGSRSCLISSPAISADGTIYIGSQDNMLYAVNPDGTLEWSYYTEDEIWSSPVISADGTVYVGSLDNKLYALNPDGSLKWSYKTGDKIYASPVIGSFGTIYILSQDRKIYALDHEDGGLIWSYQIIGMVVSSPAVGKDGTIYIACMLGATPGAYYNRIYALNQDGTLKWTYQNETQPWSTGYSIYNNIHSSPAIGTDGSVYVGSYDGHVYALNPDGDLKWDYKTNDVIISSPAIGSDGTIYIGSYDGYIYALNKDGSLKWIYQTGDIVASSPAIGEHGTIYIGCLDGRLFAFGIIDKTPPVILCPEDMYLSATGSWTPVNYSANVFDTVDPDPIIVYNPARGSDFPLGETGVIITATDFSGNSSACNFKVVMEDTNPEPCRLADTAWPCWGHDTRHTGRSPYIGPSTSALQWTYKMAEDNGKSPPAIGPDGIIYVGSTGGNVYALYPDGSLSWIYETEDTILYSATIAADGTIYIGSSEGNIYALDSDGGLKWSYKTGDKIGQSPAIASDGTLYAGSFDKKIYAINPDGSLKWDYQAGDSIPSSPAIDIDGTIYFVDYDGKIYAINPDGSLKWDYQTYDRIYSSISIGSDGTVYAGSHDSRLYALNPDGSLKWRSQIGDEVISSPAIGPDGTIYIGNGTIIDNNESVEFGNGKVNAFNRYGTLKWSYQTGSFVSAPPAIDAEGTIYTGDWDGMVYAISPDGSLKWSYQTGGAIFSSPAIGPDGTIYVRCSDGNIYALGDTQPPEIICPANMLVPAINSIYVKVTYEATVTDNIDPNPVVVYKPRSGYDFIWGTTEVKATATDFSGNVSTCTFKVTVKDLIPPDIICPADLVVPDTGNLTEVSYSATVTDNLDRSPYVTYSPKSGSEFPVGTTEVLVKAKDYSGSSATCTFNVTVKDNPPDINCPVELIFPSTGDLTQVNYSVAVTDTIDPNPSIIYDPEPGSGFPSGTTLVRVVATDLSGNSSTCDFNLIVRDMPLEPGKLSDAAWPCLGHDSRHTGRSPYLGAQTNRLKWTYKTMSSIRCSPAIGTDGTIYIGSWDEKLYALNPDGTMKWYYKTGQSVSSSPAIGSDGTIYFGSEDHNIYALNPNGSLKWSYQSNNYVFSSPVIDADGTIYVGSHDGSIYALNPDGSLKWSYPTGSYVLSSPAIGADGIVYVGGTGDNRIYALDPEDGSLLLSFQTGGMVKSSPAIGDDGAVYIGSYDGKLYALNPNFTLRWSFQTGDKIISSPAIAKDGTIYIGSYDGRVYAINSNGSLKWSYKTGGSVTSTAAIGADGTVYIGGMDKNIYAFNPDGTVKWSYQAGQNIHLESPAIGKDGTIYIGCMDCRVYAFAGEGSICFYDADNDGYGDHKKEINSDSCPEDYVTDHTDCDDQDNSVYPGALELCDGKDNDCDGVIPNDEVDSDSDGYLACNDCNDNDRTVYPGASGRHNGKDNDCNGTIDSDEKKAVSLSPSYQTYLPLMLSPWLQPFQPGPMNYQQQVLATQSFRSVQYNVYKQFPWNISYQTPYYQNIFSRNIYQYSRYQYNQPGSLFDQAYWSWPNFKFLNTSDNQFFPPTFYY